MEPNKLEALRARRAELEAKREARKASDELANEAAEVAQLELLETLEAEHGPLGKGLAMVTTPDGPIFVKRPASSTYRKFVDLGKTSTVAFAQLVKPCVVHPSIEAYMALLEDYPAVLLRCANAVCELAGHRKDEEKS